jgi:hypothetical protein
VKALVTFWDSTVVCMWSTFMFEHNAGVAAATTQEKEQSTCRNLISSAWWRSSSCRSFSPTRRAVVYPCVRVCVWCARAFMHACVRASTSVCCQGVCVRSLLMEKVIHTLPASCAARSVSSFSFFALSLAFRLVSRILSPLSVFSS